MAPPIGSKNNPHGRPRDLSRELTRLEEAATHVSALMEQKALINALVGKPIPHLEQDIADGAAELVKIKALVERLHGIAAMAEPSVSRASRRRRRIRDAAARDDRAWQQAISTAAVSLDRLCGEENAQ